MTSAESQPKADYPATSPHLSRDTPALAPEDIDQVVDAVTEFAHACGAAMTRLSGALVQFSDNLRRAGIAPTETTLYPDTEPPSDRSP